MERRHRHQRIEKAVIAPESGPGQRRGEDQQVLRPLPGRAVYTAALIQRIGPGRRDSPTRPVSAVPAGLGKVISRRPP